MAVDHCKEDALFDDAALAALCMGVFNNEGPHYSPEKAVGLLFHGHVQKEPKFVEMAVWLPCCKRWAT